MKKTLTLVSIILGLLVIILVLIKTTPYFVKKYNNYILQKELNSLTENLSKIITDKKVGKPFIPTPVTKKECETLQKQGYKIDYCFYDNDYFAGAVKACRGKQNMPTIEQLQKLPNFNKTQKANKVKLWSNQEISSTNAYNLNYSEQNSFIEYSTKYLEDYWAVCTE